MPEEVQQRRHLGDGVYVHFDGFHVVLTTSDGYSDTNTIYLDPDVVIAYQRYLVELAEKLKK